MNIIALLIALTCHAEVRSTMRDFCVRIPEAQQARCYQQIATWHEPKDGDYVVDLRGFTHCSQAQYRPVYYYSFYPSAFLF